MWKLLTRIIFGDKTLPDQCECGNSRLPGTRRCRECIDKNK